MKLLYLVRHGQTLFNKFHKIQGWCDSPLTSEGILQAKRIGSYFKREGINFDHAYCSTSERCIDTLSHITDMPFITLKGLKEMNYGILEGESENLISHLSPKDCETFFLQYKGESSNDTKNRMVQTLTALMEKENHQCVLVISHGGACFNFLRAWQDPSEELKKGLGNGCIFVYQYANEQFKLIHVYRQEELV